MKRRWQPGVLDEVAGAILYLEGERPGLGTAFRASLERTLALLEEYPLAAPVVHRNARRALVHGFRTVVIYGYCQLEQEWPRATTRCRGSDSLEAHDVVVKVGLKRPS